MCLPWHWHTPTALTHTHGTEVHLRRWHMSTPMALTCFFPCKQTLLWSSWSRLCCKWCKNYSSSFIQYWTYYTSHLQHHLQRALPPRDWAILVLLLDATSTRTKCIGVSSVFLSFVVNCLHVLLLAIGAQHLLTPQCLPLVIITCLIASPFIGIT